MAKTTAKSKQSTPEAPVGRSQLIELKNLRFDPENPRTVERLGNDASQGEIEGFLLGGEMKARDLVPSFIANGYIPYEPLIVQERRSKGIFTVVEGNRRLAALRSMMNSDVPEEKAAFVERGLSHLPCVIFNGNERDLLAYLGLRHLSKTKDWTTAAKGAFVERVLRVSDAPDPAERLREAGRLTNTSTSALRLTLAFDDDRFEKLITWLYGNPKTRQSPIISSIRDIPYLNQCLGDPRATRSLENGSSLKEAMEELEAAGATVSAHLERAKKSVQRAGTGLSDVTDTAGLQQIEAAHEDLRVALAQFAGGLGVLTKRLNVKS